jgi:RNA polymerase sigma-70 factor (ECF subfamily)
MEGDVSDLNAGPELLTDEEIVARVLAGEKELFAIIMRRHGRRLFSVAVSVLRNGTDAEDVVQDTYMSAYRNLHQFAGRAKFSAWIRRIALHRAIWFANATKLRVPLDREDGAGGADEVPDACPSPEHRVYMREVSAVLDAAVASLPDNYRSVLLLRTVEETDTGVTAKRLQISPNNVKVRLHRARAMLRESCLKIMHADPRAGARRICHHVPSSNHKHLTSFGHRRDTCKHAPA